MAHVWSFPCTLTPTGCKMGCAVQCPTADSSCGQHRKAGRKWKAWLSVTSRFKDSVTMTSVVLMISCPGLSAHSCVATVPPEPLNTADTERTCGHWGHLFKVPPRWTQSDSNPRRPHRQPTPVSTVDTV